MVRLETERLIIRDHQVDDLEHHHKLMSDIEVMSYIQDIMTHSLEESKENLMFSIQESKNPNRKHYFFAIINKLTGTHIGSIGFKVLEENDVSGNVELGYFIFKKYWGKGYTYEAAKIVVDYIFSHKYHKITTGCIKENKCSEKIMLKLDMTKESELVKHVLHDHKWKTRVTYRLLREEHETN